MGLISKILFGSYIFLSVVATVYIIIINNWPLD